MHLPLQGADGLVQFRERYETEGAQVADAVQLLPRAANDAIQKTQCLPGGVFYIFGGDGQVVDEKLQHRRVVRLHG